MNKTKVLTIVKLLKKNAFKTSLPKKQSRFREKTDPTPAIQLSQYNLPV